jgi:hypothetical protein
MYNEVIWCGLPVTRRADSNTHVMDVSNVMMVLIIYVSSVEQQDS